MFTKEGTEVRRFEPTPMEIPFTSKEIKAAVNLLKNNKSTGCDGISAELLKQSPETIYDMIAEIYNKTASTGERPK